MHGVKIKIKMERRDHLLAADVEPADVHLRRLKLLQDLQHSSCPVFVSEDNTFAPRQGCKGGWRGSGMRRYRLAHGQKIILLLKYSRHLSNPTGRFFFG